MRLLLDESGKTRNKMYPVKNGKLDEETERYYSGSPHGSGNQSREKYDMSDCLILREKQTNEGEEVGKGRQGGWSVGLGCGRVRGWG